MAVVRGRRCCGRCYRASVARRDTGVPNPKFASEQAENSGELPNRDTSGFDFFHHFAVNLACVSAARQCDGWAAGL